MSDETSAYMANFQRGVLLRSQRRYKEATEFLSKAIEVDPEKALAYAELALSLNDWGGRDRKALGAIDRAISLEPTNAHFIGLKGWILVCQHNYKAALQIANRAIEMDPVSIIALSAQTNAYTKLGSWKRAEASAERILALDAHNIPALNLLAQALRLQGKGKKRARDVVCQILALFPDDAFGHMNAGYGAMEVGDHLRANEHFLNSLRMDPHCELAQRGLLHSLRARVWIYRWQFRIRTFFAQPATFLRVFAMISIVAGIVFLEWCQPGWGAFFMGSCFILAIVYFYLNFFSLLTGDFFLLFDPLGRYALTRKEKFNVWLFAIPMAFLLFVSVLNHLWGFLFGVAIYLGVFAFSIYYPQIKDRWQMRKEH